MKDDGKTKRGGGGGLLIAGADAIEIKINQAEHTLKMHDTKS